MTQASPVIVATYAEIALKGRNRTVFLRKLLNNIRTMLKNEPLGEIRHVESRLLIEVADTDAAARVSRRLHDVFGLQWVSPAVPVSRDELDAEIAADQAAGREPRLTLLCEAACGLARENPGEALSFKVATRRSDRTFALGSPDINRIVGRAVHLDTGLPGRMQDPDLKVNVLVMKDQALVFHAKETAHGGLPAGSSGRVMVLMSGGIDSPVAAWLMMRRGCRPEFVHFFSGRTAAEADTAKIEELVRILAGYFPRPLALHLVPVVPYEQRAIGAVPDSYDMVMFRRFMFKTAAKLASLNKCKALVTGDSLGQVASQTIHNLGAIAPDVRMPVLRPLIGMDKIEITAWSRKVGLFDTSILPYRDCCSIRSPKPVLTARPRDLMNFSRAMDLDAAVREAALAATEIRIDGPSSAAPTRPD
ncbi:MAG: tRNA uracil 4-sulfurtransferase ThiI [bacterium]